MPSWTLFHAERLKALLGRADARAAEEFIVGLHPLVAARLCGRITRPSD
jgi:hypothetical protein